MTFKCNKCGNTKELNKTTTAYRNGKWVTLEANCICEPNTYMDQILTEEHEGFPTIKRNDSAQKL
tara:strand:+ start:792 stop:986 length:195 start_codon:yes stop_codon:yes gene_type:complete